MLAGAVLEELAAKAGIETPGFLEVTVEEDGNLDLADFTASQHVGVLLDGVSDALLLKKHRETLQGRPKLLKGAKSATMKFAYSFTLCRKAIVATMDTAAENLDLLASDPWLADSRNIVQLHLRAPAWMHTDLANAETQPQQFHTAREEMATWKCKAVKAFLQKADLEGPAATLFANGVNGGDLVEMTAASLMADVRVTKFTASKVLAARDSFLASY